ncbi:MAG: phosphoribosyl-AMP cyclohydrolase, partial [Lachnospiraceae bacterium]|nr:phosphoribosyl-AMP cyclohydrolase [Lachnospiraceae bacterium]
EFIHVVDLDGAREGVSANDKAVKEIVEHVKIPIEIGGGVRSFEDIEHRLSLGVSRVIVGTKALSDPDFIKTAVERFGTDKIVVGIDAKNGHVATEGWENVSSVMALDLALRMKEMGVKTIIYTDISRDGMLNGPNIEQTKAIVDETGLEIIASGGVSSIDDLRALSLINVSGVIFGKAIYEKKIDLKEAVGLFMDNRKKKKIIASIDAENETRESVLEKVSDYDTSGVDMLFIYNYSKNSKDREDFYSTLRLVRDRTDLPFMTGVFVDRLEDVKKAYYAGACKVIIDMEAISDPELLSQAVTKIGKNNVYALVNFGLNYKEETIHEIGQVCLKYLADGVGGIMVKHLAITPKIRKYLNDNYCDVIIRDALSRNSITEILELPNVSGIATNFYEGKNVFSLKKSLSGQGFDIATPLATVDFESLKTNEKGLVPVIVQDYRTNEVLMMAYMNAEAYGLTIETGRMTYFSRSRNEIWVKGETSGHYQYVKALYVDCDSDTILARVKQIGA